MRHPPGKLQIGQEQGPQGPGNSRQLPLHTLIEVLEDLGGQHQDGHLLFLDTPQDGLGLQGIQIGDFRPGKEGHQQRAGEGQGMVQGEDGEHIVIRPDDVELGDAPVIGEKILLGEHHSFGKPGGARGIDDGGQVVGVRHGQSCLASGCFRDCRKIYEFPAGFPGFAHHHDLFQKRALLQLGEGALGEGEDDPGPGLLQGVMDMVPAGDGVQGDGHRTRQQCPEITHGPLRPVLQEDGHPVALFHSLVQEPPGHGQAVPVKLAVGVLPHRVPFPLDQGYSVRIFPADPG